MLLHILLPRSAACARGLRDRRPAGGSLAERFPFNTRRCNAHVLESNLGGMLWDI